MKTSNLIVGAALFLGGTVLYLTNYRRNDKEGKIRSRVGLGILFVATMIAFGEWIFDLVLSGN